MKTFLIILVIATAIAGPIATIWALNTLFPVLQIDYNFQTWVAVMLLGVFIRADIPVITKE